jgi:uncharacterized protein YggE
MKTRYVLLLAACLLTSALFAGIGVPRLAHGVDAKAGTVVVNATGSVDVVPDTAELELGVSTRGQTADAAMAANNEAATRLIAAIRGADVSRSDIATQSVALEPRMSENGDSLVGYTASNVVRVTVHRLANAGAVIDAAVGAGANVVSGPSLSRDDSDALYRTALKKAVDAAQAKAGALGEAGHFTVGAISSVVEREHYGDEPVAMYDRAASVPAPIEAGTQQVTASVTVTFAIS